jgi:MFS family permease
MLYVFAFSFGLINVVDNPTRQTFISEMVGEENLKNAISLNFSMMNLARAIGPAAAGLIIMLWSISWAFFLNAFSFLAVMVMLSAMDKSALRTGLGSKPKGKGALMGLKYIWTKPKLKAVFLMMALIGTITYEFQVSLPLIAQRVFAGDAASYSILASLMAVGSFVGGVFMASKKKADTETLVAAAFFLGLATVLAAFMPVFALASLMIFFVGFFSACFTTLGSTTMQLGSDPQLRGRVMSFWAMAMIGSTAIGGPIVGLVGDLLGPRWSLGIGGLAAIIAAVLGKLIARKDSLADQEQVASSQ